MKKAEIELEKILRKKTNKNIEKYYDNTENEMPNYTVKKFIELNVEPGNAVELGCGAGRDTVYLIRNGWNVLAIDREDVETRIVSKLLVIWWLLILVFLSAIKMILKNYGLR